MKNISRQMTKVAITLAAFAATACQSPEITRPKLTGLDAGLGTNTQVAVNVPVAIPAPPQPSVGALWVPGSKQFFKDSRAHAVGDIVTVTVAENAAASSNAKTDTARSHSQQAGILGLPWISGHLKERGIPLGAADLASTNSDRSFSGSGKTNRTDSLTGSIAAVVTQILPNGLLVIQGQREVLVNYERQTMTLQGMIRPEDITSLNTIPSTKIAEARIAYAGNGEVDDSQTPQYGVKWLDKVLPF